MEVKVGLVSHGVMTTVKDDDGNDVQKFIAATVTIWLERDTRDTENMHKDNFKSGALAVARRKLGCDVFPIEIEEPKWLPARAVKKGGN